jgi:hypothetical protein
MYKGLILGGLAFGAAFGLERVIAGLGADMKRYDKLRAMSGQGPFLKELLSKAGSAIGDVAGSNGSGGGLLAGLTDDVVRYAKMKGM